MKKQLPRYCGECGAALVATPSSYASCPSMHGRLLYGKPDQFAAFIASIGVDCRELPIATRKGVCFAVDGLDGQYRLRRPDDGEWQFLVKNKKAVLARDGARVLILVERQAAPPVPASE